MGLNFFVETFALGLKNIHLHKLRSLLTTLGIIFGVAAVIIMVAIGEGTKQAALAQMRQLGARNILLRTVPPPDSGENSSRAQSVSDYGLRLTDPDHLSGQMQGLLSAVVPMRDTEQKVTFGERSAAAHAIGTVPQIFDVLNLPLEPGRGRVFNKVDLERELPVCVLGALAAKQLFPYQDPVGQWITVGAGGAGVVKLQVVGVLEQTGLRPGTGFINREVDLDIYFPLTVALDTFNTNIIKRKLGSSERKTIELTEVWLQVPEERAGEVESIAQVARNVLERRHPAGDYEVKVPIEILRNAERLNRMFNFIMVGIASFSLVVGGIGIMNIMLASITERTKEIGIRRALGAKRKHITLQFLVETTVISLAGGAVGIALGCGVAWGLPWIVSRFSEQNYPTQIASWSVIGSFMVSGLIGVGFGLYPAVKAAMMNPIEALRHAG